MAAAASAASRQCALWCPTTPRNERSVGPWVSQLYFSDRIQRWTTTGVRQAATTLHSTGVIRRFPGTLLGVYEMQSVESWSLYLRHRVFLRFTDCIGTVLRGEHKHVVGPDVERYADIE